MGGAAQAKIETRNLPASAITFVSRTAEQWSIGAVSYTHLFARAGRPDDRHHVALADVDVDTAQHLHMLEVLLQALDLNELFSFT